LLIIANWLTVVAKIIKIVGSYFKFCVMSRKARNCSGGVRLFYGLK